MALPAMDIERPAEVSLGRAKVGQAHARISEVAQCVCARIVRASRVAQTPGLLQGTPGFVQAPLVSVKHALSVQQWGLCAKVTGRSCDLQSRVELLVRGLEITDPHRGPAVLDAEAHPLAVFEAIGVCG